MRFGATAMRCVVVAAMASVAIVSSAVASVPSLIAGLHRGDELRYTYTLTTDETIALTGKTGPDAVPMRTVSTQTVGVVFRVTADTTTMNIVEATFETVNIGFETEGLKFQVDVAGPAPDEKSAAAREVYGWFRPLVGAKITLNVAPGSGEITQVQGGEELLKTAGAAHLRRYLDPDLLRATLGTAFQLKSNSSMPPPGDKWYVKTHVYGRGAKAPVWETRVVEVVEGDVANIKGITRASAKPEDATKTKVFFRGVDTSTNYWWDTVRGRLTKAQGSATISTRFDRAGGMAGIDAAIMQDSDMACVWSLELVEKDKTIVHPTPVPVVNPASKPVEKPVDAPVAPAATKGP